MNVDPSAPLIPSVPRQRRRRDNRTSTEKKLARASIILSAGLERLAFYSLAGNLTFFLASNRFAWQFPNPIIVALIFLGTSNISALFFSWISDGKLGRSLTILIGFLIYITGYVFFSTISNDDVRSWCCPGTPDRTEKAFTQQHCVKYIAPMLVLTAIGVGAVQANTAVLGAEQVSKTEGSRYFDYYYAAINVGALVAYGAIAYIQLLDYFIGYMISTGLLGLSFLCYLIGYKFYFKVKPHDSVVSILPQVIFNAIATWYRTRKVRRRINSFNDSGRSGTNRIDDGHQALIRSRGSQEEESLVYSVRDSSWSFLDYAKLENDGSFVGRQVEDIKGLRRVVVVFLLLISYWLVYFQVETTFVVQGAHMQLPTTFTDMPVVWLSLGNQIVIIVLIFILNSFVYKRLENSGRSFSLKTRMILGLVAAVLAMVWAGTIEVIRVNNTTSKNSFNQTIGNGTYTATDMSIFYQFPQYIGIGVSEVFTSVASLEFAYQIAPQSAQSLIMSLRFCSSGISSFIGSALIVLFELESKGNSANKTDTYQNSPIYYTYFFSLAGLQTVFIFIFLFCDYKYKILRLPSNPNRSAFFGSISSSTT